MEQIPEYTKNDFMRSTKPFEFLMQFNGNKFIMQQQTALMKEQAANVGVKNFMALFKAYLESVSQVNKGVADNITEFDGQEFELRSGCYVCDDYGVAFENSFGCEVQVCNHPIMPTERLINVDTGVEKLKIAFKKGVFWRSLNVDKEVLANSSKIIALANYGVAVNSENAKYLVRFFTDIENLNYKELPEFKSVSRLGWIEGIGFSPYVDNLVFDGDETFSQFFKSVKTFGEFKTWIDLCKDIRKSSLPARILLASSFASVLVAKCDSLPFFVHVWGGTEAGKTVGLMLAASVWASPEMGKYIHTFNSTAVAQELSASFVNSLPLIIDELQIIKDKKDFDSIIYQLSEGVGRARGQKNGGLQRVGTWRNCILTTGEYPIGNVNSGGGAINRIIEIDCKEEKLFSNPVNVVEVLRCNYGHAGKAFVEWLSDKQNLQRAKNLQKSIYKQFSKFDTTEKQAASASLILTADRLADELFFDDGKCITIEDILPFLSTKKEVSQNERALEFLYDYFSINSVRFCCDVNAMDMYGECWGKEDDEFYYIINSQFNKIMTENGYNAKAFLSWAAKKQLIRVQNGKNTVVKKIFGKPSRCVCIKKADYEEAERYDDFDVISDDDMPFE